MEVSGDPVNVGSPLFGGASLGVGFLVTKLLGFDHAVAEHQHRPRHAADRIVAVDLRNFAGRVSQRQTFHRQLQTRQRRADRAAHEYRNSDGDADAREQGDHRSHRDQFGARRYPFQKSAGQDFVSRLQHFHRGLRVVDDAGHARLQRQEALGRRPQLHDRAVDFRARALDFAPGGAGCRATRLETLCSGFDLVGEFGDRLAGCLECDAIGRAGIGQHRFDQSAGAGGELLGACRRAVLRQRAELRREFGSGFRKAPDHRREHLVRFRDVAARKHRRQNELVEAFDVTAQPLGHCRVDFTNRI